MMISGTRAKKLIENKKAKLIDVRTPVEFANGTLPNATNMPIRNVSQLMKIDRTVPVIFFGNEHSDVHQAENYAIQLGFNEIYSLNSIKSWSE